MSLNSWRPSPFIPGRRYRVREAFQAHRDRFQAGEILTYDRDAYSAYHGCTGYFFSQPSSDSLRSWAGYDNDDPARWNEFFEAMA